MNDEPTRHDDEEFVPPSLTQALRTATGHADGGAPDRKWVLIAIPVCVLLAVIELLRALGGNGRSWAYTLEWPFFAGFIGYMYWKLGQPEPSWDDEPTTPSPMDAEQHPDPTHP